MTRRGLRGDDGSLTVFVAVVAAGLIVALGLVVDGGRELAANERANSIAQQAARAGAQALDTGTLRATGVARLDPTGAIAAADAYLSAAGVQGEAHATSSDVTVEVTIQRSTDVLGVIGIHSLTAHGHGRARIAPGVTTDEVSP